MAEFPEPDAAPTSEAALGTTAKALQKEAADVVVASILEHNPGLGRGEASEIADHLRITAPSTTIVATRGRWSVVPLRLYAGESEMVVGCGNDIALAAIGEGIPLYLNFPGYEPPTLRSWSHWWEDKAAFPSMLAQSRQHRHPGQYTVNPNPAWNPSVAGFFGDPGVAELLPPDSLKRIICENICPLGAVGEPSSAIVATILRVLRRGGVFATNGFELTKVGAHRLELTWAGEHFEGGLVGELVSTEDDYFELVAGEYDD